MYALTEYLLNEEKELNFVSEEVQLFLTLPVSFLLPGRTGTISKVNFTGESSFLCPFFEKRFIKKIHFVKNNGIMQEKNEIIWKKLSVFYCFTVMKD